MRHLILACDDLLDAFVAYVHGGRHRRPDGTAKSGVEMATDLDMDPHLLPDLAYIRKLTGATTQELTGEPQPKLHIGRV